MDQIILPKNIFLPHFEIVQNFHYFVRSAPVHFLSKIQFSEKCLKCCRNVSFDEWFLQHLRQFLENWIFDRKSIGADLTKKWKFCTISKWVRKYFLAKLFVGLIKRNISTTFEAVFGKLNFWRKINRRGPYKIVKILYYLKMG